MRYKKELINAVMEQKKLSFKNAVNYLRSADYERRVMRDLNKINRAMKYRKYY